VGRGALLGEACTTPRRSGTAQAQRPDSGPTAGPPLGGMAAACYAAAEQATRGTGRGAHREGSQGGQPQRLDEPWKVAGGLGVASVGNSRWQRRHGSWVSSGVATGMAGWSLRTGSGRGRTRRRLQLADKGEMQAGRAAGGAKGREWGVRGDGSWGDAGDGSCGGGGGEGQQLQQRQRQRGGGRHPRRY